MNYSVIVGNVGTVFSGSRDEAIKVYEEYVQISKCGRGRAGGEPVTLFCGDEIEREHVGDFDIDLDSEASVEECF